MLLPRPTLKFMEDCANRISWCPATPASILTDFAAAVFADATVSAAAVLADVVANARAAIKTLQKTTLSSLEAPLRIPEDKALTAPGKSQHSQLSAPVGPLSGPSLTAALLVRAAVNDANRAADLIDRLRIGAVEKAPPPAQQQQKGRVSPSVISDQSAPVSAHMPAPVPAQAHSSGLNPGLLYTMATQNNQSSSSSNPFDFGGGDAATGAAAASRVATPPARGPNSTASGNPFDGAGSRRPPLSGGGAATKSPATAGNPFGAAAAAPGNPF